MAMRRYSMDLRERVYAALLEGASSIEVGERFDVSDSYVRKVRLPVSPVWDARVPGSQTRALTGGCPTARRRTGDAGARARRCDHSGVGAAARRTSRSALQQFRAQSRSG